MFNKIALTLIIDQDDQTRDAEEINQILRESSSGYGRLSF